MFLKLLLILLFTCILFYLVGYLSLAITDKFSKTKTMHTFSNTLFIGTILSISLYAIILTSGESSYIYVVILLLLYFIFKNKYQNNVVENKNIRNRNKWVKLIYPILVLIGIFLIYNAIKTKGTFLFDLFLFRGEHYFYSELAINIFRNHAETTDLGNAYSGVKNTMIYHYFDLYLCSFLLPLNIPVLLIYEYVIPPFFIFLTITPFLQKASQNGILLIIITILIVISQPKIPIHSEYITQSNFIFHKVKLLLIIQFLVFSYLEFRKKDELMGSLIIALLAIIYPTTIFAVLSILGSISIAKLFLKRRKIEIQGIAILIIIAFAILGRNNTHADLNFDASYFYTALDHLKSDLLITVRMLLTRHLIQTAIFVWLIYLFLKKKFKAGYQVFIFIGILGAVMGRSLYWGDVNGIQLFTNFYDSLMVIAPIFLIIELKKKQKLLNLYFVGYFILFLIYYYAPSNKEKANLIKTEYSTFLRRISDNKPAKFLGSIWDKNRFLTKNKSLTNLDELGKEILNYSNIVPVNLIPVEDLINDESIDDNIRLRLKSDQITLMQSNGIQLSQSFIRGNFIGVISVDKISKYPFVPKEEVEEVYCRKGYGQDYIKANYYSW